MRLMLTIRTLQDAILTKNVVTFCMRYQSYFGMNLFQMIAFSWKLSWMNSKQDGIHHVITIFVCAGDFAQACMDFVFQKFVYIHLI
jgi:hypothetical protein